MADFQCPKFIPMSVCRWLEIHMNETMNASDIDNRAYIEPYIEPSRTSYPRGGLCDLRETAPPHAVVLTLIAIVATIENLLVLLLMWKHAVLRAPSLFMYSILAFADLLTAAIVTPLAIAAVINELHGRFKWPMICLLLTTVSLSLATVVMISIDRLCQVYFLQRYSLTNKRLCIAVMVAWFLPVFFAVAFMLYGIGWTIVWLVIVFFLASILVMIASYLATIIFLRKHSSIVDNGNDARRDISIQNHKRAVNTTLIIIVTFILMNLPTLVAIMSNFAGEFSRSMFVCFFSTYLNG